MLLIYQLTGKSSGVDVTFKLNEEFTFLYPILHENVKVILGC